MKCWYLKGKKKEEEKEKEKDEIILSILSYSVTVNAQGDVMIPTEFTQ